MNRRAVPSLTILSLPLLLLAGPQSWAGSPASLTITNLSSPDGATFQVNALNSAGDLTGYFYGSLPAHAFLYQNGVVSDLGTLGGTISEGFALNASGQVVGASYTVGNAQFHGVLFSGGAPKDLGTLGGTYSSASAINDAGQVAGGSLALNASYTTAFLYDQGAMVSLGTLGGAYSSAFALNNLGQVAGESFLNNGDTHGFVTVGGVIKDLGTLGGTYSSAFAINDAGVVVGESSVNSSNVHGFIYSGGIMTDLGTLGGTGSSAFQVNTNNQVAGDADTSGDLESHGFIYSEGALTDLGTLGGTYSTVYSLNNRGQVVGESATSDGTAHAFLWQKGQLKDLNTLLPSNSGWELSTAQFINDAGRVVGVGQYAGISQTFILDLPAGNNPPVAIAGPDQTVDCQNQVTLDGSGSSDPDNDPLTFEWSSSGTVLGSTSILGVSLPLGTNLVTLKVTDPSGASAQTNVTVIVADNIPPTGSCPASATASADGNCQAAVPSFTSQVVATDNCTASQAIQITQNPAAGTLVGLGPHTVTMTVTDSSGNASSCSVLFTVADTTPPTILNTPDALTLSAGSDCQVQVPNLLPGLIAMDSCTPANQLVKTQNPAAGTVIGIGDHNITLTVADAAGNSSTASVLLRVSDTTTPTILGVPSSIKISASSSCQGVVPNVLSAVLVSDNCTPANQILLAQNPAAGTALPLGDYSVTVTATDAAGNSSSSNVPLEISDTTPPVIQSLVANPSSLSPPNHQLVPVTVSALVADNCDAAPVARIVSITCSEATSPGDIQITGALTATLAASKGSSGNTRVYSVTVEATDASGNHSTGLVTVSVLKSGGNGTSASGNIKGH